MSYEILYTSAPAGLSPGSSGYCTVMSSRGIPAPTVELLESLSGYRHLFPLGHAQAKLNPVNYGHYLLRISGRREHVVSRVSDFKLDYTGRSNKLAHHVVIEDAAVLQPGPAWLVRQPGFMRDDWNGQTGLTNSLRIPKSQPRLPAVCSNWLRATGDAGWAGVLAESFLADPSRKVFLIYPLGTDVLSLFDEAIGLLPQSRRWDVTFATFGAALPATVDCLWSGIPAGSPEVDQTRRFIHALRIDLTSKFGKAQGGGLVNAARTGVSATPSTPSAPPLRKVANSSPTTQDADEEIEFEAYSLSPTERPVPAKVPSGQRAQGGPPSLPSSRSRSATGLSQGTVSRFVAGGIVGGAVISAIVAVILLLPQRENPQLPPGKQGAERVVLAQAGPGPATQESTTPASTTPASTTPASTTPASTTPASTTPASTTPASTTPASTTPASTTPASTTPASTTPASTTPASTTPASTTPASTTPASITPAPYVICMTKSDPTEVPNTCNIGFPVQPTERLRDIRFLGPALANEDKSVHEFKEVSAENTISPEFLKLSLWSTEKILPWSKEDPLKISIPRSNSMDKDLHTAEMTAVLSGPDLLRVPPLQFSGLLLSDGDRPYIFLFRPAPLRFTNLPQIKGSEFHPFPDSLLTNEQGDTDAGILKNNLLNYGEKHLSDFIVFRDIHLKFPGDKDPPWEAQRLPSGEYIMKLPGLDEDEQPKLSIKLDLKDMVLKLHFSSKYLAEKKKPKTLSNLRMDLKERNEDIKKGIKKEWLEFSKKYRQGEQIASIANAELQELYKKFKEGKPSEVDRQTLLKAADTIERWNATIDREKVCNAFFDNCVKNVSIDSGRISYRIAPIGNSKDSIVVDLVVIGDVKTDVQYCGIK